MKQFAISLPIQKAKILEALKHNWKIYQGLSAEEKEVLNIAWKANIVEDRKYDGNIRTRTETEDWIKTDKVYCIEEDTTIYGYDRIDYIIQRISKIEDPTRKGK